MKKIKDRKKLQIWLDRYDILSHFSDPDLPFELVCFDAHEIINNLCEASENLLFFVSGKLTIRNIRDDGTVYLISETTQFIMLGDVEYADMQMTPHIVEAAAPSLMIVLPLKGEIREKLDHDPVFLRYLLSSVAGKFIEFSSSVIEPKTLRERLLFHLENTAQDCMIRSVVNTSDTLQCSRRQLLRILKQLCEEGIIEKTGKGTYRLIT